MINVVRIFLFVIVNIAGFYTTPIMANIAARTDRWPHLPPGATIEAFKYWYFAGGPWVWIACALLSISYFFVRNTLRNWLLFAPLYIPALYCTGIIAYFNYVYRTSG